MNTPKRRIDVCPSPALYTFYEKPDNTVVMIDAIRASASIVTALMNGASEVLPLSNKEETFKKRASGYIIAGERDGYTIKDFDFGNSPLNFTNKNMSGKKPAFTTTNGTRAVRKVIESKLKVNNLLVGSFINISAVAGYLKETQGNILILCSGWKNKINTEDNLFAGELIQQLNTDKKFHLAEGARISQFFSKNNKQTIYEQVMELSPRLKKKSQFLEEDFKYCFRTNLTRVIPVLDNERFIVR